MSTIGSTQVSSGPPGPELALSSEFTRFELWADDSPRGNHLPKDLQPFYEGVHYLSLKQVPSVLGLKRSGSSSVKKNYELLLKEGFTLLRSDRSGGKTLLKTIGSVVREFPADTPQSQFLSLRDEETFSSEGGSSPEEEGGFVIKGKSSLRIEYEDPWLVLAGRFLAEARQEKNLPKVLTWFADVKSIEDQVDPSLFQWEKFGSKPPHNKIRWAEVSSVDVKIDFLWRHTFWGAKLQECVRREKDSGKPGQFSFLMRRIKSLLWGKPDPLWSERKTVKVYGPDYKFRDPKQRSHRFIEMLRTAEGVFCQRYLAFPLEVWNWEKYDLFTLSSIAALIGDEFYDGEMSKNFDISSVMPAFAQLKRVRKTFKRHALAGTLDAMKHPEGAWLRSVFSALYEAVRTEKDTYKKTYLIGVLSQTRGAGKPPPIEALRSKLKFFKAVTTPVEELSNLKRNLLHAGVEKVLSDLPDAAFTGLSTKARITVSSSACWEKTQQEGGTVQAIQDIVYLGRNGDPCKIFNLHDATVTREAKLDELEPGEYIFWKCLEFVLKTTKETLREAYVVTVNEPGKARIVTKAHACLKIVLDVVNKICAEPLRKGVPSSTSGMGKSSHGWNLFRDCFKQPAKEVLFRVKSRTEERYKDFKIVEAIYHPVFMVSTDYENATDYMTFEFSRIAGKAWMSKCGIPNVLQTIVLETCFQPRKMVMSATGPLYHLGTRISETETMFLSSRGIMMGDPLTKIILHLTNIVTRTITSSMNDISFLEKVLPKNALKALQAMNDAETRI